MTPRSRSDDQLGIIELQSAYADCVTRRAWSELDGMFRPDATLVVSDGRETRTIEGPKAIGELIDRAVAALDLIFFTNLNTRIELYSDGADSARARTYVRELHFEQRRFVPREIYGVYLDHYVYADELWWFATREWHALARTSPDLVVHPTPDGLDDWLD